MLRLLGITFALAAVLDAAVLPERFGPWTRAAEPAAPESTAAPLFGEFGVQASEGAQYQSSGQLLTLSAWRFQDATGAYAAWLWQRATPGEWRLHQNYLLRIEGGRLKQDAFEALSGALPQVESSAPPPVLQYLPERRKLVGSDRMMLGPESLAQAEPRIGRDLAAFDRGAEAVTARYRLTGGEVQLTILSYPTPQMAIERLRKFREAMPTAAVKRSGTLIALVPEAEGNAAAARLLEDVRYSPKLTWNEYVPKHTTQDAANMVLAISALAAGLIVASLIMGLFFGGGKVLARRFGWHSAAEDFTSLHITER